MSGNFRSARVDGLLSQTDDGADRAVTGLMAMVGIISMAVAQVYDGIQPSSLAARSSLVQ